MHEQTGDVDTLFIGMECDGAPLSWIYGPLLARRPERAIDQSRRANGSDYAAAMRMVEQFNCRAVYVYAMGQEPWLHYISSIQYEDDSNPIVESNRLVAAAAQQSDRGRTPVRIERTGAPVKPAGSVLLHTPMKTLNGFHPEVAGASAAARDPASRGANVDLNFTVAELFEQQAARIPDAIALLCGDARLTYRELNEQANRLAHYLRARGVTTETVVGICLRRSLETVVALLAVVKAGGAYVPLDPDYPAERLAFMLQTRARSF